MSQRVVHGENLRFVGLRSITDSRNRAGGGSRRPGRIACARGPHPSRSCRSKPCAGPVSPSGRSPARPAWKAEPISIRRNGYRGAGQPMRRRTAAHGNQSWGQTQVTAPTSIDLRNRSGWSIVGLPPVIADAARLTRLSRPRQSSGDRHPNRARSVTEKLRSGSHSFCRHLAYSPLRNRRFSCQSGRAPSVR